jgi:imidazolonepropionase
LLVLLYLGTTTVECKSGYGLEVATEVKMLRVLEKAKKKLPIDISSTFLGGHSVPKYVTEILFLNVIELETYFHSLY